MIGFNCMWVSSNAERMNTKRPTLVFFWDPRNLSNHMDRQAHTGDTVIVKSREMTGRSQVVVAGAIKGKDDRNKNTLASLI
jgi:hypothetical protein